MKYVSTAFCALAETHFQMILVIFTSCVLYTAFLHSVYLSTGQYSEHVAARGLLPLLTLGGICNYRALGQNRRLSVAKDVWIPLCLLCTQVVAMRIHPFLDHADVSLANFKTKRFHCFTLDSKKKTHPFCEFRSVGGNKASSTSVDKDCYLEFMNGCSPTNCVPVCLDRACATADTCNRKVQDIEMLDLVRFSDESRTLLKPYLESSDFWKTLILFEWFVVLACPLWSYAGPTLVNFLMEWISAVDFYFGFQLHVNMSYAICFEVFGKLACQVSAKKLETGWQSTMMFYLSSIFFFSRPGAHCSFALRGVRKVRSVITYLQRNGNPAMLRVNEHMNAELWQTTCIPFYILVFLSCCQYFLRHFRDNEWTINKMVEKIKYMALMLTHGAMCFAGLYRVYRYARKPSSKCIVRVTVYVSLLGSSALYVFHGLLLAFINADCHVTKRQMFFLDAAKIPEKGECSITYLLNLSGVTSFETFTQILPKNNGTQEIFFNVIVCAICIATSWVLVCIPMVATSHSQLVNVFKYLFEQKANIRANNQKIVKKATEQLLAAMTEHHTTLDLQNWIGFYVRTGRHQTINSQNVNVNFHMHQILACLESMHASRGAFTCGWDIGISNHRGWIWMALIIVVNPLCPVSTWILDKFPSKSFSFVSQIMS